MKFDLKRLSADGVAAATRKAEHYRLLNEPRQAESICLDVLHVEPENQEALVLLLLARTDMLEEGLPGGVDRARESRERLIGLGIEADYREYPMEHSISPEALRDIVQFLETRVFGGGA